MTQWEAINIKKRQQEENRPERERQTVSVRERGIAKKRISE